MSAAKKESTGLVVGGEPRIDFLPPEIKARKQARRTRRSLLVLSLIVVAVCAAGYVFAAALASLAQTSLAEAQERTQVLLKEQAEYSDVRTVTGQISATENARILGSATEVLWKNYLAQLVGTLPAGVTIEKFTVVGQSATDVAPVPSVLLQNARISTITFSVRMPALADAEAILVNLKSLPGYADAWVTPIEVSPDGTYTAEFTLNVNSDVLERRFSANPDADDGGPATEPLATDPSATETPAPEED
jgi:anti-sigma factor RsiW